jgi:hypothetical protein
MRQRLLRNEHKHIVAQIVDAQPACVFALQHEVE